MKKLMMTTLLATTLLAGGPVFGAQISIRIGPPPPPRVIRVLPASPGPEYVWVDGYWYPVGRNWAWHQGYWTRAPYTGARWLTPRYESGEYYEGYWEGEHGRIKHEHKWDKDKDRDFHGRGRGRGHDRD